MSCRHCHLTTHARPALTTQRGGLDPLRVVRVEEQQRLEQTMQPYTLF
jgi:hypothetical protein